MIFSAPIHELVITLYIILYILTTTLVLAAVLGYGVRTFARGAALLILKVVVLGKPLTTIYIASKVASTLAPPLYTI
jgi:hypothetical protein